MTTQPDQHYSGRVVWPTPMRVEETQQAIAALQSGVQLSVPAQAKIWRWKIVKAQGSQEVVQWTTSDARTLLVPPGEYQIVVQPEQHKEATVVWPQAGSLVVSDGQIAQAALDALAGDNTGTKSF